MTVPFAAPNGSWPLAEPLMNASLSATAVPEPMATPRCAADGAVVLGLR
jgi:hypothetical protein